MDTSRAQELIKDITTELSSLDPSELITLYEIDASEIKTDLIYNKNVYLSEDVFRFHNMNNLKGVTLYFGSVPYYSFPMQVDGFQMNAGGAVAKPTMTITAVEGMSEPLSMMKKVFLELENLIGAKVIRIRTLAKYLNKDANDNTDGVGGAEDAEAELPRDIFYIERKSVEDKNNVQFELSSILDLQNLSLPARTVYSARCPFTYRGEGCLYEYKSWSNGPTEHDDQKEIFGTDTFLPDFAPPVADAEDQLIKGLVSEYDPDSLPRTIAENFKGEYDKTKAYAKGDVVFLEKDNVKYYFVGRGDLLDSTVTLIAAYQSPPNDRHWVKDQCSKSLKGCKLRWGTNGKAIKCQDDQNDCSDKVKANNYLNFGGFPGTNTRVTTN